MPTLIAKPTRIEAAGTKPKRIDEYVGRVNSGESAVSIAHMRSPAGWIEPGQTPGFDEYTVVLRGMLRVESREGTLDVHAGQAVLVRRGEWVRYSTPGEDGAEYIAVCLPAFSPQTVHRDDSLAARDAVFESGGIAVSLPEPTDTEPSRTESSGKEPRPDSPLRDPLLELEQEFQDQQDEGKL
jgi:mannose-6-phosphate isomerase-like protein (cupin superfamily)